MLRWVVVGALTLGATVPLLVTDFLFFPFISGKNFAFRILIEIAFTVWIVLVLRNPAFRPRASRMMWSVGFFIVALGAAALFAEDSYKAIWSNFERMEGFVGMFHFALAFVVAGSMFRVREWRTFILVSLGVNAIVIGYALLQFFGVFAINQGGVRVDATFGNAIYLGVYALFHLLFSLLAFYTARREKKSVWLLAFLGALVLGNVSLIFLSATRGLVLGLMVGLVGACIVLLCSRGVFRRWGIIGLCVAVLAVGGFFALRETPLRLHPIFGRVLSVSLRSDDTQARFIIWRMALSGALERPVLGWGQEGFSFVFNKYYDPALFGREQWFDRAHNTYIDWLIAAGMVGFVGYFTIWFFAARVAWAFALPERALWFGFGTAYATTNFFVFDNGVSYFFFFMLLAYLHYRSTENQTVAVGRMFSARFAAPLALLVLVASLYYFNARPAYAGTLLLRALRSQPGGPAENLEIFKRALAQDSFATAEIREQLAQATAMMAPVQHTPLTLKQEFLTVAATELDKEIKRRPADARYYSLMGSVLDSFGLYDQGVVYWREASLHSPRKQTLLFQLGVNRFNAGKVRDAVLYFKQAYDINPANREAVIYYAAVLIYAGEREEEARVLQTPSYAESYRADSRLIAAYRGVGRMQDAIALWEKQLALDPDNSEIKKRIAELRAGK